MTAPPGRVAGVARLAAGEHPVASLRHVVQQAGWAGGAEAFGIAARYALAVLLARLLGADGLGVYALAIVFAQLGSIVATFGLDQTLHRYLPRHMARGEGAHAVGLGTFALAASLSASAAVAAVVFLSAGAVERWLGEPGFASAVRIAACMVPAATALDVGAAGLRGLMHVRLAEWLRKAAVPTLTVAGLVGAAAWTRDPVAGVWAALAATLVVAVLSVTSFVVRLRRVDARARSQPRRWLRFSAPMGAEAILVFALLWTDTVMVGWLLRASDAGLYTAAARLAAVVSLPLVAVNAAFAPAVSHHDARRDSAALQRLYSRLARLTLVAGLVLAAGLWSCGSYALAVFSADFAPAYPALAVLVAGQLVNAATGSSGVVLSMTGHQRLRLANAAVAAAANAAGNAVLVPRWGLVGAATATAASLGIVNVLQVVEVRRFVGLSLLSGARA